MRFKIIIFQSILVFAMILLSSGIQLLASCNYRPTGDINEDCEVNILDFALLAANWLINCNDSPENPACFPPLPNSNMVFIVGGEYEMGDHYDGNTYAPMHLVYVDTFYISSCEITNQQYCDFLNSAKMGNLIKVVNGVVYAYSDVTNLYPPAFPR